MFLPKSSPLSIWLLAKNREAPSKSNASNSWYFFCPAYLNKRGFLDFFMFVLYSTLLRLPPLRFHCVGGCWDRTQDSCDFGIGCQTLKPIGNISYTLGYISSILGYISSTLWIHAKHKLIRTSRCRLPQFLMATQSMVHKWSVKNLQRDSIFTSYSGIMTRNDRIWDFPSGFWSRKKLSTEVVNFIWMCIKTCLCLIQYINVYRKCRYNF